MNISDFFSQLKNPLSGNNNILEQYIECNTYPKGYELYRAGAVCTNIFFIEKGFARISYLSGAGRDVTTWFFSENSYFTDVNSFYNNSPANESCILNEESIVFSISYENFKNVLEAHTELGQFCFSVLFEITKQMTEYINLSKFATAEERYNHLISRYPEVLQKASLGQIASFLGISQETLSRIRSKK